MSRAPRWLLAVALALGLSTAAPAALPQPERADAPVTDATYFEAVGDAQSIPDGVVTALAEDAAGFLWIGTTNGLIRFDGYRLRRYAHVPDDPSSLGGNLVRALRAGRDGRLWVGTDVDGVSVYDPRQDGFSRLRHAPDDSASLSAGAVFAFAEDAEGRIWIGSRAGGLDRYDPASGQLQHFGGSAGLADARVNALSIDAAGQLWVGTLGGLFRLDPRAAEARRVGAGEFDPAALREPVYSLFSTAGGTLWAGTRDGTLMRVDRERRSVDRVLRTEGPQAGGTASVFAFAEPRPGELWVGRTDGIEVRDAASGTLLRRLRHDPAVDSSLAGNDVRALLVDRAGLLWAGGFGSGLQRHDPGNRAIRVLRAQHGFGGVLQQPNIVSILELPDGRIWLGTRGRGIAVLDPSLRLIGGFPPGDHDTGLDAGWITALAHAPNGDIWAGSRDGAWRFDPARGRFTAWRNEQGLPDQSVRRLLVDPAGTVWAGTGNGLYRLRAGAEQFERMALQAGGELAGDINALARDAAGQLWAGGANGLFVRPAGADRFSSVQSPASEGLGHISVLGLLVDGADRLWVDTPAGLYLARERLATAVRFEPVSAGLGLAGNSFGANLIDDDHGRIWTHHHRYDPASGELQTLTRADGVDIGTGWFRAYARLRDGRLLFGGSEGLLVIDPDAWRPWAYSPPLVVSELKVAGLPQVVAADGIRLTPTQRSFSVEFAALDFSAPERIRYRHRLRGFDDEWTDSDAAYRVARYSNLWPGRYTLQIRGSNRLGVFGDDTLELPVMVLPAWWQTPWAAALALLLLAAAIAGGVRLRTARIRSRAQQLQQLVDRRTAELSHAKQRAEAALSELQGAQTQLVAAEKMASLGQLVAGVAHEINTPIGIAVTAASHLQDSTRGQRDKLESGRLTRSDLRHWHEMVDEATRLIQSSLGRAHDLVGSFKRVAVDQSSEQRRRFELLQFLHEVQFALQPSYRRNGHALEIDCPPGLSVDTYPGALFQIVTNFVTNSVTHGFRDSQNGRMSLRAECHGDMLRLHYRDNGSGMPAEIAARAFDPFFTTRRGKGGSGLGLHLVWNLTTQLLGGTVELRTAPGEGTEFVLSLPLVAPPRRTQPDPARAERTTGS